MIPVMVVLCPPHVFTAVRAPAFRARFSLRNARTSGPPSAKQQSIRAPAPAPPGRAGFHSAPVCCAGVRVAEQVPPASAVPAAEHRLLCPTLCFFTPYGACGPPTRGDLPPSIPFVSPLMNPCGLSFLRPSMHRSRPGVG